MKQTHRFFIAFLGSFFNPKFSLSVSNKHAIYLKYFILYTIYGVSYRFTL